MPRAGELGAAGLTLLVWWALWSLGDYYLVPSSPLSELVVLAVGAGGYLVGVSYTRWCAPGRGQRYARSGVGDAELGAAPVGEQAKPVRPTPAGSFYR